MRSPNATRCNFLFNVELARGLLAFVELAHAGRSRRSI